MIEICEIFLQLKRKEFDMKNILKKLIHNNVMLFDMKRKIYFHRKMGYVESGILRSLLAETKI